MRDGPFAPWRASQAPSTAELLRRASGIDGSRQASGKFDEKVQEPPKP